MINNLRTTPEEAKAILLEIEQRAKKRKLAARKIKLEKLKHETSKNVR